MEVEILVNVSLLHVPGWHNPASLISSSLHFVGGFVGSEATTCMKNIEIFEEKTQYKIAVKKAHAIMAYVVCNSTCTLSTHTHTIIFGPDSNFIVLDLRGWQRTPCRLYPLTQPFFWQSFSHTIHFFVPAALPGHGTTAAEIKIVLLLLDNREHCIFKSTDILITDLNQWKT